MTFENGPLVDALAAAQVRAKSLNATNIENFRRHSGLLQAFKLIPASLEVLKSVATTAGAFDLIYANSKKAVPFGLIAGKLAGKPVLIHIHDIIDEKHFSRFSRETFLLMTNALATAVITNSQATKDAFVKLGGCAEKTFIVHNGFNKLNFEPIDEQKAVALKDELGLLPGAPVIGCFGRISLGKGQAILLKAATRLQGNVQFLLVGAAPFGEENYLAELQEQAAKAGLIERVKFTGFRSDVNAMMQLCDIVVHPAIHPEAFGRTIVEAQLSRTPVVATNTGGVGELISHGKTGLLCDPGDANQIAARIEELLSNKELRDEIIEAGYEFAVKNFSLQATFDRLDEVIGICL